MRIPIRFPGLKRPPSHFARSRAESIRQANDRAFALAQIAITIVGTEDKGAVKDYCKELAIREGNPDLSWTMIWNIAKNIIKNGGNDGV